MGRSVWGGALSALLGPRLAPHRRGIVVSVLLQAVQTVALLYLPTLNAQVIDEGLVKGDTGQVLHAGGLMLLMAFFQGAAGLGVAFYGARTTMTVSRELRAELFGRVRRLSPTEVERFGVPSLMARMTNDVAQIEALLLLTLTLVVSVPVACVGGIVLALRQNVALTSLLFVAIPLLALTIGLFNHRLRPTFHRMQYTIDTMNRVLREQIIGVRVVRAFVREEDERRRFAHVNAELQEASLRVGRTMAVLVALMTLLMNLSGVAVVWFGGHLIDTNDMRLGALAAFLTYLAEVLGALIMLGGMVMAVPRAQVSAVRVDEVLRAEPGLRPPRRPVRPSAVRGTLELRGLGFQYPGAESPVLRGIDLQVRPGQTVAFIGSTGSGKSTLLNLIPRLVDATEGTVRIDGVDVRELDPAVLSAAVGLVPQKPHLFTGTVATNLRYGAPDATDEQLWHALEVAQAREFVERTVGGLDHPLAQAGANLSGGQRQRLVIARTLLRRPALYLFDDSFSALDGATELALRQALAREAAHRTVLLTAQRVSTVRDADQVVVLDRGRIVGSGTHSELAESNEIYQQILKSQTTIPERA
ncbi:ABC transporter ATP-binding protein [Streptomyces asiaticus]|uniref:ABC transporter ATP-binding protein n=1 Tax=Streptomyces asiaticus TaxID=114695 RepID=UPI003D72F442